MVVHTFFPTVWCWNHPTVVAAAAAIMVVVLTSHRSPGALPGGVVGGRGLIRTHTKTGRGGLGGGPLLLQPIAISTPHPADGGLCNAPGVKRGVVGPRHAVIHSNPTGGAMEDFGRSAVRTKRVVNPSRDVLPCAPRWPCPSNQGVGEVRKGARIWVGRRLWGDSTGLSRLPTFCAVCGGCDNNIEVVISLEAQCDALDGVGVWWGREVGEDHEGWTFLRFGARSLPTCAGRLHNDIPWSYDLVGGLGCWVSGVLQVF